MPPDSSCGYGRGARCGDGMPTRSSSSTGLAACRPLLMPRCWRSVSAIWLADREDGVQAGHGILEDHRDLARRATRAARDSARRAASRPSKLDRPADDRARARARAGAASGSVTLLPEPDSPTSPSVSPASHDRARRPLTAHTSRSRAGNAVARSRTRAAAVARACITGSVRRAPVDTSVAASIPAGPASAEAIGQAVADQAESRRRRRRCTRPGSVVIHQAVSR